MILTIMMHLDLQLKNANIKSTFLGIDFLMNIPGLMWLISACYSKGIIFHKNVKTLHLFRDDIAFLLKSPRSCGLLNNVNQKANSNLGIV